MSPLSRDLRFALAPLAARAVYAMLFAERRAIAEVVAVGHEPVAVAAQVLGVERAEAEGELAKLRALGLVGDGLTLLVGVRRGRATTSTVTASGPADLEPARAALASYTGSRRALARELGCSEGALRAFAAGRSTLGPELRSALAAYLDVRTNACVPACVPNASSTQASTHPVSTQSSTQPLSPSDSPSPSLGGSVSPALSDEEKRTEVSDSTEGEGVGEGTVAAELRTECVPAAHPAVVLEPPAALAPPAPREERTPRTRTKRPRPEPPPDPVPLEGTEARRVYDAILSDAGLRPITAGPGDLALRLAAICDGTGISAAAEVVALGGWLHTHPGWSDGRAALLRNITRKANEARRAPRASSPTPGGGASAARPAPPPARVNYQGQRVVGAAALPPGSVWEPSDRDEEQEWLDRIRERTQPRGAPGR